MGVGASPWLRASWNAECRRLFGGALGTAVDEASSQVRGGSYQVIAV